MTYCQGRDRSISRGHGIILREGRVVGSMTKEKSSKKRPRSGELAGPGAHNHCEKLDVRSVRRSCSGADVCVPRLRSLDLNRIDHDIDLYTLRDNTPKVDGRRGCMIDGRQSFFARTRGESPRMYGVVNPVIGFTSILQWVPLFLFYASPSQLPSSSAKEKDLSPLVDLPTKWTTTSS